MGKARISPSQLFALIVLFEFGTALVVPIGLTATRGVWLSILLALCGGIVLYLIFDYLFRQFPTMPISGYARVILGRYIGWPLGLLYVGLFTNIATRNLRDAGDLLITSSYDQTPLLVINSFMIIAAMYVMHKGIEVLGRIAEIYLAIVIVLGAISNLMILFSGLVDLKNLKPLLAEGWKPILEAAYPNIFLFPFGEMVCFTALLPLLNKAHMGRKTGIYALVMSGVMLSITHAVEVSVLGVENYARASFPLFTTISLVNIADFLQRLDALVILTLIIGAFFKMTTFCYASIVVASDLFKVQDRKQLVLPVGIIVLLSSLMFASSFTEHIEEGKVYLNLYLLVFCFAVPVLLFAVHLIRKRFGWYRNPVPVNAEDP